MNTKKASDPKTGKGLHKLAQHYTEDELKRIDQALVKAMMLTRAALVKAAVAEYLEKRGI